MLGRVAPALLLLALCCPAGASPPVAIHTSGASSPAISQQGSNATAKVYYSNTVHQRIIEHVGKKIAIRSAYLLPTHDFAGKRCAPASTPCVNDLKESAFLHLQVQSIWPEPVLLTAGRLAIVDARRLDGRPGMKGVDVLAEHITANWSPERFLLAPGEVKSIALEGGVRLHGVMSFFNDEVAQEPIVCLDASPCTIPQLARVDELNRFLQARYGRAATLRVTLYEKDYQPLLTAAFRLSHGGDLFSRGDVRKNDYRLQHDAFIGEVLYQLQGGTEAFPYRREKPAAGRTPASP